MYNYLIIIDISYWTIECVVSWNIFRSLAVFWCVCFSSINNPKNMYWKILCQHEDTFLQYAIQYSQRYFQFLDLLQSCTVCDIINFWTKTWIYLEREKIFQNRTNHSSSFSKVFKLSKRNCLLHRHFNCHFKMQV